MPSTFSPALRIELIGSGEQVGVWGNTTNNNLGDLVEQAITGSTEINVTAADVTLTALNGVTDQARSAVLIVTGTAGVARAITIPNANKAYTVKNRSNTTVQIKTASGTAFDVPTLSEAYVYCNGLNVITGRVITDGANAITSLASPFNSPAFTGTPTAPTASLGTSTTQIATTAFVNAEIASDTANLAPLNSPALTGVPTAPTASVGTNTTQLATTAFVNAEIANDAPTKTGTGASGTWGINITGNAATATNATNVTGTVASGVTGTTQTLGTNNTTIATTAFVQAALPVGSVIMWYGLLGTIPTGWQACDGTNGTPDLRDRFVVGAGTTYALGATGGANSVTLTTAQIPSHTHTGSSNTVNLSHTHTLSGSTTDVDLSHSHGVTDPSHTHTQDGNIGGHFLYSAGGGNPGIGVPSQTNVDVTNSFTGITIQNALGNHAHSFSGTTSGMSANESHSHTISIGNTGGGESHENRPPYLAIYFIMKV